MRIIRIVLHAVITIAIIVLIVAFLRDLFRGIGNHENKFLCFSLAPLLFAALIGFILEFRRNRKAAFVNTGIPAVLAGVLIFDAFKFAELEAEGFVLILSLVPICFAVAQGILYYLELASD